MDEEFLVVAEAVQLIEDGKVFGFVGIERSRKHYAIRNAAREDLAGDSVAFDAAGSKGRRDDKEAREVGEIKEKPEVADGSS